MAVRRRLCIEERFVGFFQRERCPGEMVSPSHKYSESTSVSEALRGLGFVSAISQGGILPLRIHGGG